MYCAPSRLWMAEQCLGPGVWSQRSRGGGVSAQQLVLIVNSDPKEQRVLTVSLKKVGLSVRAARDGFEALQMLNEDRGDIGVVSVDLNLDRMDGFELCERIRDDGRYDGVALLAMAGSKDLATRLRAYETGFDELLEKPVYIKEIATRVELMLERRAREVLLESEAEEVRGELGKVGVSDLMQTIASGKRTGFARVLQGKTRDVERTAHTESLHQDDEVGQFFFENGELIDAEVGRLRGESAMYRMM